MNNPTSSPNPPLAQAFSLKELPGWLGKTLLVPPGRQGIALNTAGRVRLFRPGQQKVLSAVERLSGQGAGLRAGYLPAQGFQASLKAANLLSGDNELLDASLLCQVEVADPARFFAEVVIPQGQVKAGLIDLSQALSLETIGALAARYAAADLVRGLPTQRLAGELSAVLEPALGGLGLRLAALQWIVFWRAAQRVEIAAKAQALEERLKELELDKEMAEMERKARREDFARQLQDETAARPVEAVGPTPPPVETMRGWLTIDTSKESGKRHLRIEGLLGERKKKTEETPPARRQMQRWLTWRIIALVVLGSIACLITAILYRLAQNASWDVKWEALLIIWGPLLAVFIESAVSFFKKREDLEEIFWQSKGYTVLDDLSRNNRQRADQLVREQTAGDLGHVRQILNDVRSRVYSAGNEALALRLRELERKVDARRNDVLNPQFGAAPYVSDLKISRLVWDSMLDQDEELLAKSAQLSNQASALQQKLSAGEALDPLGADLENKLDELWHLFANRAHALRPKPPQAEQDTK